LSNTLITISDNKIGVDVGTDNTADFYEARVLSASDYYAFGMGMKERSWQSEGYRYGFNGKENDSDWEVQDYGFRIYKPELGKFLSVDPLTQSYPWYTPYQFAGNMPINSIDVDGAEELNAVLGIKVYTGYPQTKISFSASITGALNSRTASNVPNIISPEGGLRIEANYYAQMFASGPGMLVWGLEMEDLKRVLI
jgi:RHS repeat-associated protein